MKRLALAVALALAIPFAGWTMDLSGGAGTGGAKDNLARALLRTASSERASTEASGHAFQFSLAPVAFFSMDSSLNKVVPSTAWGGEAGFIYWLGGFGVGLSGQYVTSSGSGSIDGVNVNAQFNYYNIFFDVYGKFFGNDKISIYGTTGLGYSNARLSGHARSGHAGEDFSQNDSGVGYKVGLGVSAPWVFGEFRFTESSFNRGKNEEGDAQVANLDALQLLIGMRTP